MSSAAVPQGPVPFVPGTAPTVRLVRPLVRNPWPLTAEQRRALVDCVFGIIASSKDDRDRLAAVRLLLELDWLNLEQERLGRRESLLSHPAEPGLGTSGRG
jgi:hypothetical protein